MLADLGVCSTRKVAVVNTRMAARLCSLLAACCCSCRRAVSGLNIQYLYFYT